MLEEISRDRDVNFFDFAGAFPTDRKYYVDGRHVTVEGSRLKAVLFAEYLITEGLLPRRGR
jgi:hypothetical protein